MKVTREEDISPEVHELMQKLGNKFAEEIATASLASETACSIAMSLMLSSRGLKAPHPSVIRSSLISALLSVTARIIADTVVNYETLSDGTDEFVSYSKEMFSKFLDKTVKETLKEKEEERTEEETETS